MGNVSYLDARSKAPENTNSVFLSPSLKAFFESVHTVPWFAIACAILHLLVKSGAVRDVSKPKLEARASVCGALDRCPAPHEFCCMSVPMAQYATEMSTLICRSRKLGWATVSALAVGHMVATVSSAW